MPILSSLYLFLIDLLAIRLECPFWYIRLHSHTTRIRTLPATKKPQLISTFSLVRKIYDAILYAWHILPERGQQYTLQSCP